MPRQKAIKCVVWDLDNTLWNGRLAEEQVSLRPEAPQVLQTLDNRGIVHSIASRNDIAIAIGQLRSFGIEDYFLVPQIHWGSKSTSLQAIADNLNIGLDAIAFVDDDPFEREEVGHVHPEILLLDATKPLTELLALPSMTPRFVTEDSRRRRFSYREDFARRAEETAFDGPSEAFLATLDMHLTIAPAKKGDLERIEELTERAHQLNATGCTYSYQELEHLYRSPNHLLLVADLKDRFGGYGRIGIALIEHTANCWVLKLLIVSCRVMSRGTGSLLLRDVMCRARTAGARLKAEFRDTGRNRIMNVTYRLMGFRPIASVGDLTTFEHDLNQVPSVPDYVRITSVDA